MLGDERQHALPRVGTQRLLPGHVGIFIVGDREGVGKYRAVLDLGDSKPPAIIFGTSNVHNVAYLDLNETWCIKQLAATSAEARPTRKQQARAQKPRRGERRKTETQARRWQARASWTSVWEASSSVSYRARSGALGLGTRRQVTHAARALVSATDCAAKGVLAWEGALFGTKGGPGGRSTPWLTL